MVPEPKPKKLNVSRRQFPQFRRCARGQKATRKGNLKPLTTNSSIRHDKKENLQTNTLFSYSNSSIWPALVADALAQFPPLGGSSWELPLLGGEHAEAITANLLENDLSYATLNTRWFFSASQRTGRFENSAAQMFLSTASPRARHVGGIGELVSEALRTRRRVPADIGKSWVPGVHVQK